MKLNRYGLFGIFLFLSNAALAQFSGSESNKPLIFNGYYQSLNQENNASIASFQFDGNFAVHLVTDDKSNFILLNFALLDGEFEKNYFIKEVYNNQLFIQYGHGLSSERAWVVVDKRIEAQNTISSLTILLANVKAVSVTMTALEKQTWLTSQTN